MMSKAERELKSWLNGYLTGQLSWNSEAVRTLQAQLSKLQGGR